MMYCNVVSCLANVLLHTHNDVAQTGGGGMVLRWSRRQSAALSAVMMCFEVSSLSTHYFYYFMLANFAHHSQNFLYKGCRIEFHLPVPLHPSFSYPFDFFALRPSER